MKPWHKPYIKKWNEMKWNKIISNVWIVAYACFGYQDLISNLQSKYSVSVCMYMYVYVCVYIYIGKYNEEK